MKKAWEWTKWTLQIILGSALFITVNTFSSTSAK